MTFPLTGKFTGNLAAFWPSSRAICPVFPGDFSRFLIPSERRNREYQGINRESGFGVFSADLDPRDTPAGRPTKNQTILGWLVAKTPSKFHLIHRKKISGAIATALAMQLPHFELVKPWRFLPIPQPVLAQPTTSGCRPSTSSTRPRTRQTSFASTRQTTTWRSSRFTPAMGEAMRSRMCRLQTVRGRHWHPFRRHNCRQLHRHGHRHRCGHR
jgi:hypothetical protein